METPSKLATEIQGIINQRLPTDLIISTTTELLDTHGLPAEVISVNYRSGNECVPLTEYIDDFRKLGKVTADYRGRGANETPRIVFNVEANDDNCVIVVWHLPQNE